MGANPNESMRQLPGSSYYTNNVVEEYVNYAKNIGLWRSEQIMVDKYFPKGCSVLDLGCGTGRTTIPLFQQGWTEITGIDLSDEMIAAAQTISQEAGLNISFVSGSATKLKFTPESFAAALYSYNGLMCIPNNENRKQVMAEIHRVLKKSGIFIFTTHDRDRIPDRRKQHWLDEKQRWDTGTQDKRLFDFGDVIDTDAGGEFFINIPSPKEIVDLITAAKFEILETKMRSEICEESTAVTDYSGECRFWVVQKS